MPYGIELFSFDLFGLSRKGAPAATPSTTADAPKAKPEARRESPAEDDSDLDRPGRHEIFFWGLFPVL